MIRLCALAFAAASIIAQYLIWFHAPVEESMGVVQKIFYTHMPLAWWSTVSFFVNFVASILYLAKRRDAYSRLAGAAAELGVLFSGLALITGMCWARPIWNVWWTWDPRLTTTLVMWFVYAAYLLLRASDVGGQRQDTVLAVLGVVAFLDVPLVFISARYWRSIHPSVLGSQGGGMEPEMWLAVLANLVAMGLFWLALLAFRTRQLGTGAAVTALMRHGSIRN
ncbi:MAG: ABC-type transport system involved in cytochrome c biogenesis, permease component [Solidesulfovibrio magneticus str. Maddingley MBC34]|uniref:Heme exporter protein C n=1 Tax=Solidesulfovibrio magneticus str. Maddingley MBC34 TaxID=1206767 RepID=K6H6G0_9BACT|nr:MAG: ABC-type transport system involved in cytochrome c biogenesis, permease component [Solidesulfovibrio magneticus str. Maddingley MBC34]